MENNIYRFHPSAKNYIGNFFLGGILILTGILAIVGIGIILYVILKIKSTTYTITSEKVVAEHGLLAKRKTSVFLSDIRNVEVSQSFSQRIFNLGTVNVSTAGNSGYEIVMPGISAPDEVVQMLNAGHK